jgi:hypothetical protein
VVKPDDGAKVSLVMKPSIGLARAACAGGIPSGKFNITFEERRRRTVTVTAGSAVEARAFVEKSHGPGLEELIATRVVREAAYCAQYIVVGSVEETTADLGGSLGYEGATHARRST